MKKGDDDLKYVEVRKRKDRVIAYHPCVYAKRYDQTSRTWVEFRLRDPDVFLTKRVCFAHSTFVLSEGACFRLRGSCQRVATLCQRDGLRDVHVSVHCLPAQHNRQP